MQQRIITIILLTGLTFGVITLVSGMSSWRLPDNQQGYSPKQQLNYSHRLHAGELQIDCRFCHVGAEKSRHAGIPSTDVCMKCHKFVTSSFDVKQEELNNAKEEGRDPKRIISPELKKLYDSLGLDDSLNPKPDAIKKQIPWVRVHNLPDYVYFDHSAHLAAGVSCERCHGPIQSMQRVSQFADLSMGWCVNCHRDANEKGINDQAVHASTDCTTCHY